MTPELKKFLEGYAEQGCWDDTMDELSYVIDFCGSNVDDAYEGGRQTGEVTLARRILEEFVNQPTD